MAMEMNAKVNPTDYQSPPNDRHHHVRNLWPPVGGGLPGGKPVEPALGSSATVPQMPPDRYGQSTSYGQYKPRPTAQLPLNVGYNNNGPNNDNIGYYYKSSQTQPDPAATAINGPTAEYDRYYGQPAPQKDYPSSAVAATNHWCPPPPPPPAPPHHASQFYRSDPTTMFNQVNLGYERIQDFT